MNILAVDTSTTSGSVAISSSGKILAARDEALVRAHATWLMPAIDELFSEVELTIEDIDLFALSVGPGSFTGLRIGVSTIKGLAWSLDKPVVGVSTLKALAMNITTPGALVCPVLDARKKELYAALYRVGGDGLMSEELLSDRAIVPSSLFDEISRLACNEEVIFLGSGLNRYKDDIEDNLKHSIFAEETHWRIKAVHIARLSSLAGVESIKAQALVPLYKRRSDAEVKPPSPAL